MKRIFGYLLFFGLLAVAGDSLATSPKDLLIPGRFSKHIRATAEQAEGLTPFVDSLRSVIAAYQWERGRRTFEGRIWLGFAPTLKQLHTLEKNTRKKVDALLDSVRVIVTDRQEKRLTKILKSKPDLLDYPISETPFYRVNNSPLNSRSQEQTDAYKIVLPNPEWRDTPLSHKQLIRAWTVRNYVQAPLRAEPGLAESPDLQYETTSPTLKRLAVQSPLLLSATIAVPELMREEFDLLFEHYPHTFSNKESAWNKFAASNRLSDTVLIRLKMSTPGDDYHLKTERYIIYIEDSNGIAYEPLQIEETSHHKLEALEIDLPGRSASVTDVFGRYTGIPGYTETQYLELPSRITYAGQEKLLKLYFPGFDFQGRPILREGLKHVKLVVKPEDGAFPPLEMKWNFKKKLPDS
jgi:hypothetical protein